MLEVSRKKSSRLKAGALCLALFAIAFCATAAYSQGRIVFSSSRTGNWELWAINADGSGLNQLTRTQDVEERKPACSPDGTKIAFSTSKGDIWVMGFDGSGTQMISGDTSDCNQPVWHPDGKSVVFVSYRINRKGEEDSEILIVEFLDKGLSKPRPLFEMDGSEEYPSWSPDGGQLIFARFHRGENREPIEELWLWDVSQEKERALTKTGICNFSPRWSPVGDVLAFTSNLQGSYDVWTIGMGGGHLKRLTSGLSYDGDPSWSPDAGKVVFVSSRSGSKQLWITDADGANQRQLTKGLGECKDPCWSSARE